jgi:hypothetical protein
MRDCFAAATEHRILFDVAANVSIGRQGVEGWGVLLTGTAGDLGTHPPSIRTTGWPLSRISTRHIKISFFLVEDMKNGHMNLQDLNNKQVENFSCLGGG